MKKRRMQSIWKCKESSVQLVTDKNKAAIKSVELSGVRIICADPEVECRFFARNCTSWHKMTWDKVKIENNRLVFNGVYKINNDANLSWQISMQMIPRTYSSAGKTFHGLGIRLAAKGKQAWAGEIQLTLNFGKSKWRYFIQDLYTARKCAIADEKWGGAIRCWVQPGQPTTWMGQRQPFEFMANQDGVLWCRLDEFPPLFGSNAKFVPDKGLLSNYVFTFNGEKEWKGTELAVLFARDNLVELQQKNLWGDMFLQESERFRHKAGVEREEVLPLANYPICGGTGGCAPWDKLKIEGTFDQFIHKALPLCNKMGFKRIMVGAPWISMRTEGIVAKCTDDIAYDSRCGTIDFKISPRYGGEKAFRRFCDKAHEDGIEVFVWYPAFHLANWSPYLTQHPEWIVRQRTGEGYTGEYMFHITTISPRFEAQKHFLEQLRRLKKNCRLDGLWLDSYVGSFFTLDFAREAMGAVIPKRVARHGQPFGMADEFAGKTVIHKRVAQSGQGVSGAREAMDMVRRYQDIGFKIINEGFAPFGARGDGEGMAFKGQEDMALDTNIFTNWSSNPKIMEGDSYFRFLANKGPLTVAVKYIPETVRDKIAGWNKAYNRAVAWMERREILKDDQGVLWTNQKNKSRVILFLYKPFVLPVRAGTKITNLSSGKVAFPAGDCQLDQLNVYQIDG